MGLFLQDKINQALRILRLFEPPQGYYLAFSGGKDSSVIVKLAEMSGVKFTKNYNVTTLDPPELVRFIKKTHPDAQWHRPKLSMWQLIIQKGFPPTRFRRYCCSVLKEGGGKKKFVLTGVRWEESFSRSGRFFIEANLQSKSKNEQKVWKSNALTHETKEQLFATKLSTKHCINIIIDWTEEEVWDFIHLYQVPYCSLYDEGFDRLGCVGCPLQSKRKRARDFERWPRFKELYLNAFDRMLKQRKFFNCKQSWQTKDDVMKYYLELK